MTNPKNQINPSSDATRIESLINQGKYFEARSKAEEVLKQSEELRVKQLYALSISKSGAPESAMEIMEPAYKQFPDDPESAGILGSIYKELFKKNQSTAFAIKSRDTYFQNFSSTQNYYTGINAASMSAMAGQASRGREIATQVMAMLENNSADDFWKLATLGEACLLLKNRSRAIEYFIQARKHTGNDWGKITSVHNQLWLLNHFVPVSNEILKIFSPPKVVAFIGHMIDHPNRATPRFPASIEQQVKNSIVNSIRTLNARIGYSSLACGGDILFAEAMEAEGGEVNIFLPFSEADFIEQSIRFAGDGWVERYKKLVQKFPPIFITKESYAGFDDLFSFQNRVISGVAALRSASHHAEPTLLTVLSEVDLKRKKGGTRDTIHLWPFPDHHVNINPDIFVKAESAPAQTQPAVKIHAGEKIDRPVLYLVYANTGKLPSIDRERLLKEAAAKIVDDVIVIKSYEVADDFLLAAFETELEAMEFVRFMIQLFKTGKQESLLRISLHAGPVYMNSSSISMNKQLSGENVEFVKEINALATMGSLLASDHFAALLSLEQKRYSLDYAGLITTQQGEGKNVYRVAFRVH
jgi:tetratricopeptide (TPR) repeat protein